MIRPFDYEIIKNMMNLEKYETPLLNVMELCTEQPILADSLTGEQYNGQDSYDSIWY